MKIVIVADNRQLLFILYRIKEIFQKPLDKSTKI